MPDSPEQAEVLRADDRRFDAMRNGKWPELEDSEEWKSLRAEPRFEALLERSRSPR